MRKLIQATLLTSLSLMSACVGSSDKKNEQLSRVVWSEDGQAQALVMLRFEESGSALPAGASTESNFSYQIFVQNADGTNRQAVGIETAGQNGQELYYMKEAGYLIASYLEASESHPVTRYYKLNLDGSSTRLTDKPDMLVIPSPDGQYIARVTQFPSTCTNPGGNCPLDVEILDAQTLTDAHNKRQLSFASTGEMPQLTWTPGNQFIASLGESSFATQADSAEALAVAQPGCFYPPTSSSSIGYDHMVLMPGPNNQIMSRPASANESPFGCQGSGPIAAESAPEESAPPSGGDVQTATLH